MKAPLFCLGACGFGADFNVVAIACADERLVVRYVHHVFPPIVKTIAWFKDSGKRIVSMAFSPSSQWLVCVCIDGSVVLVPVTWLMLPHTFRPSTTHTPLPLTRTTTTAAATTTTTASTPTGYVTPPTPSRVSSATNLSQISAYNQQQLHQPVAAAVSRVLWTKGDNQEGFENLFDIVVVGNLVCGDGDTVSACVWWHSFSNEHFVLCCTFTGLVHVFDVQSHSTVRRVDFAEPLESMFVVKSTNTQHLVLRTLRGAHWRILLEQRLERSKRTTIISNSSMPIYTPEQITSIPLQSKLSIFSPRNGDLCAVTFSRASNVTEAPTPGVEMGLYDNLFQRLGLFSCAFSAVLRVELVHDVAIAVCQDNCVRLVWIHNRDEHGSPKTKTLLELPTTERVIGLFATGPVLSPDTIESDINFQSCVIVTTVSMFECRFRTNQAVKVPTRPAGDSLDTKASWLIENGQINPALSLLSDALLSGEHQCAKDEREVLGAMLVGCVLSLLSCTSSFSFDEQLPQSQTASEDQPTAKQHTRAELEDILVTFADCNWDLELEGLFSRLVESNEVSLLLRVAHAGKQVRLALEILWERGGYISNPADAEFLVSVGHGSSVLEVGGGDLSLMLMLPKDTQLELFLSTPSPADAVLQMLPLVRSCIAQLSLDVSLRLAALLSEAVLMSPTDHAATSEDENQSSNQDHEQQKQSHSSLTPSQTGDVVLAALRTLLHIVSLGLSSPPSVQASAALERLELLVASQPQPISSGEGQVVRCALGRVWAAQLLLEHLLDNFFGSYHTSEVAGLCVSHNNHRALSAICALTGDAENAYYQSLIALAQLMPTGDQEQQQQQPTALNQSECDQIARTCWANEVLLVVSPFLLSQPSNAPPLTTPVLRRMVLALLGFWHAQQLPVCTLEEYFGQPDRLVVVQASLALILLRIHNPDAHLDNEEQATPTEPRPLWMQPPQAAVAHIVQQFSTTFLHAVASRFVAQDTSADQMQLMDSVWNSAIRNLARGLEHSRRFNVSRHTLKTYLSVNNESPELGLHHDYVMFSCGHVLSRDDMFNLLVGPLEDFRDEHMQRVIRRACPNCVTARVQAQASKKARE